MDDELVTPHRRKSDHKMQALIESPWARIAGTVLQGVAALAITVVSVTSSAILSRLGSIDATLTVLTTSRVLTEAELKQLQAFKAQIEARDITLRERITTVEAEVRNLKDRRP